MSRMLYQAAIGNAVDVAEFAIRRGADVNWRTRVPLFSVPGRTTPRGRSALHNAAIHNAAEIATLLLERGAELKTVDQTEGSRGRTALHLAATYDATDVARVLLDHGANVDAPSWYGWTALHWATGADAADVGRILLDRGASVDQPSEFKRTPLHHAASNNAVRIARILIERGADIGLVDYRGMTALEEAEAQGSIEVEGLLRNGRAETTLVSSGDTESGSNWGKVAAIAGVAGVGAVAVDAGVPVEAVAEAAAAAIADIVGETGGENLDRIARGDAIGSPSSVSRTGLTGSGTAASQSLAVAATALGKCEIPGYAEGNPDAFDPATTRLSWCPYLDGAKQFETTRVDSVGGNALNAELGRCAIELGHVAPDRIASFAETVRQSCDIVEALATRDRLDCRCPRGYYEFGNK